MLNVNRFSAVFLIFALFFVISAAQAQQLTQTIRGKVIDKDSQQPVIGATVVVLTTDPPKGTATDEAGQFKLEKIPVGRHTLRVSFMGYEEVVLSELLIGSGKEMVLTVGLVESFATLNEVVIKAEQEKGTPQNEMAILSARSISVEETKRYAASVNDPARAAQTYAGVGTSEDMSNEIVVRGNSPRGVLWRIEGVEVPNPSHFAEEGAAGGAISILSVNMLDNSDFYTGAFPAEYGNALSGIFDIKLRKGNNEKREYAFQAGVLGVDFAAEGPFKQNGKASYLANYRYSTLALLNKIGIKIAGDAAPNFQDFSYKLHIPTAKAGIFSIWGIGGYSVQEMLADRDPANWKYRHHRFDEIFSAAMGAGGVSHVYFLGSNDYIETSLVLSGSRNRFTSDSLNTELDPFRYYEHAFTYTSGRLSVLYNRKFSARSTLRTGLIYSRLGFDSFARGLNDERERVTFVENEGSANMWQAYAQWKYRLTENLTLNSGMHALYFALNDNYNIEPRAGLKWQFTEAQAISAGVGLHSRHETMSTYFAQKPLNNGQFVLPNKKLDFTKAAHAILAYDHMLREDLRLKAETYFQHLYNVPVGINMNNTFSAINYEDGFTTDTLVNKGTGRNYGVELTLEKFFTNNYYFMLTGSLYNSEYKNPGEAWRNTRFNGNHILNVLGGREFKVGRSKANLIGANLRVVWAGGNRYTPIDLEQSIAKGRTVADESRRYDLQAADYFRTDIRVSYRKNRPKASYIISLDIQNLTNRLNIYGQYFNFDSKTIATSYQTGLIPILNYRIEF
ncbi:MAG: TonB-dependent receptor [Hymenobacteraceae bacterium]|nr:TonB-dependent receptor [Hymenobacteraceae bacterium]MDX5395886.1 TonB-dependent receptor [Hymenobacteraceae bacterium]MDX5442776.1 TonB-dependent receptor [Hymenobacteraceae bacterium]MDX5511941.1 TonB-dependent receptor [Hymenobacteraceae bacterium]